MKKIILAVLFIFSMCQVCLAADAWSITYTNEADKTTGPGVGITKDYFNDTSVSRIYNQTNNNIQGDAIHNFNVAEGVGPTYKDVRVDSPIDWSQVDSGPTSASNQMYSHYIDNGGPGANLAFDGSGKTRIYSAGPSLEYNPTDNQGPQAKANIIYAGGK